MKLKDTVELMNSSDYKDRFVAEYRQLKIRCEALEAMIEKYKAGTLDFEPASPIWLLNQQKSHMRRYLQLLEQRAGLEGITLEGEEETKDE